MRSSDLALGIRHLEARISQRAARPVARAIADALLQAARNESIAVLEGVNDRRCRQARSAAAEIMGHEALEGNCVRLTIA